MSSLAYQEGYRRWQGKASMAATRRAEDRETITQLRRAVSADPNSLQGMQAQISSLSAGCSLLVDPDDYAEFGLRIKAHIDHDSAPALLARFTALYAALKREADDGVGLDAAMSITEMVELFEDAQGVGNG